MKDSKRMIYLDGFSSWPMRPQARDALVDALSLPGNSNSDHVAGWQAGKLFEIGKRTTAELIGANAAEIFVTSGATESNALALIGVARAVAARSDARKKVVVSTIEHDAIRRPALLHGSGVKC